MSDSSSSNDELGVHGRMVVVLETPAQDIPPKEPREYSFEELRGLFDKGDLIPALLDEIERLRQQSENWRVSASHLTAAASDLHSDLEAAKAENRALRNLAENLRPGPVSEALGGVLHEAPYRAAVPPTAYSVPHVVMDAIYETLKFYANLCSYEGARTGGVLAGCPRGPNPTPADLVVNAQEALWMLDRDVLGRLPVTKTYSECGACDTSGATCSNQYGICSRHGGRRTGHPQWASPHNGSAEKTTSDGVCPVCGWPVGHCNVGCTAAETEERHKPECSAVAGSVYCDCGEDERLQKLSESETPRHE